MRRRSVDNKATNHVFKPKKGASAPFFNTFCKFATEFETYLTDLLKLNVIDAYLRAYQLQK